MNAPNSASLVIDGAVRKPLALSFAQLAAIDPTAQVADVTRLGAKRPGDAVSLASVLKLAEVAPQAQWLTLHATADDFHASIPLSAVLDSGLLIYRASGEPLPSSAGGPVRFFIPDVAACHTHEIDECANVKFVDRLELSLERGYDNRPADERAHAALHRKEAGG